MNNTTKVRIERLFGDIKLPEYATKGSAGLDLAIDSFKQLWDSHAPNQIAPTHDVDHFILHEEVTSIMLNPHSRLLVGTGIKVAIPEGYEIQIRPRSGLTLKKGLTVANTPGTIDSDFRLEIGVILINTSSFDIKVSIGDKVAQAVLAKVEQLEWEIVSSLEKTERTGGFGSTDNNGYNPMPPLTPFDASKHENMK